MQQGRGLAVREAGCQHHSPVGRTRNPQKQAEKREHGDRLRMLQQTRKGMLQRKGPLETGVRWVGCWLTFFYLDEAGCARVTSLMPNDPLIMDTACCPCHLRSI